MTMVEDSELAIRIADGDRDALAAVYDRYADRLFDFCNSMLRDKEEAADAVQQCLLIAAEKMGSLRDPSKMKSWLYAVARHECLRRIRRRSREVADQEAVETEPSGILSNDGVDVEALQELVWSAANGLAPKDQALLDLHVRQGLNGQELADAVGVKASTVYVMVNRLKAQFERAMGALLVIRLARTDCPELEAVLEGSGAEFTVLLRKRVARHIDGCDICEENRQRLASPLALLAAIPLVPAPLLLRQRVLHNGISPGEGSAHGGTIGQNPPVAGPPAVIPKLSRRTGYPKDASSVGLISALVGGVAVVVAAVVTGIVFSAPSSTVSADYGAAHRTHQAPFTSTHPPSTTTQPGRAISPTTTLRNDVKGAVVTTAPPVGAASTTVPPQGSTSTTTTSTSPTQLGSTSATGPTCPLGTSRSVGMAVTSDGDGYWVAQSNGEVIAYGDATQYPPSSASSAPIASISAVSGSAGYLTMASDGTVAGAGATSEGSATSVGAACDVVAISDTPDGRGYWIALSSGAVLTFGDALSYGSALGATGGIPIVGMDSTPDGKGYWLVASNGRVFAFGDAPYRGAVGSHLSATPIVGMAPSPDGEGYYLVGSDGSIFAFNVNFYGGQAPSSSPVVAMSVDPSSTGYWILEANGQVTPYGSAETYPPG